MPTWKDVIKIGLALPETEVSTWYRTPSLKVSGKGFVRLRTEAEGGLVVLCDLEEKSRLLESGDTQGLRRQNAPVVPVDVPRPLEHDVRYPLLERKLKQLNRQLRALLPEDR